MAVSLRSLNILAWTLCLMRLATIVSCQTTTSANDIVGRADQGDSRVIDFSLTEDTRIDEEDAYICIPVEFPSEEGFIVNYEQFFDPAYVHHALLFGCPEPINTQQWYDGWQPHIKQLAKVLESYFTALHVSNCKYA